MNPDQMNQGGMPQQPMGQSPTLPPQVMQALAGGGGGVAQMGGQMDPNHHNFYEQLRQFLMQNLNIPGVDKILGVVNQQHVTQASPKVPTMPQGGIGR